MIGCWQSGAPSPPSRSVFALPRQLSWTLDSKWWVTTAATCPRGVRLQALPGWAAPSPALPRTRRSPYCPTPKGRSKGKAHPLLRLSWAGPQRFPPRVGRRGLRAARAERRAQAAPAWRAGTPRDPPAAQPCGRGLRGEGGPVSASHRQCLGCARARREGTEFWNPGCAFPGPAGGPSAPWPVLLPNSKI